MEHKVNKAVYEQIVFNRVVLLISLVCGIVVSSQFARGIYERALPNLNSRQMLRAASDEIDSASVLPFDEIKAVGMQLSSYNKKIANSKLLKKINAAQLGKVKDPYLVSILGQADEFAAKSFAIAEYGRAVAFGVGLISITLTASASWLFIFILVAGIKLLMCREAVCRR